MSTRDAEPADAAIQAAEQAARNGWQRVVDRARDWVTRELLALLAASTLSSAIAIITLPWFAAVGCALVAFSSVVYAVFARRLMHAERARRRWAEVGAARAEQRVVRAEAVADATALALTGSREEQLQLSRIRHREIAQGLRVLRSSLAQARAADRPKPASNRTRQAAPPKLPDLEHVRRRQAHRQAELEALEATIQSLANPDDPDAARAVDETRQEARELRRAALEADRAARDRLRRGRSATATGERELGLTLEVGPEGVRDVRTTPAEPSPEQIARGDVAERPSRDPEATSDDSPDA